MKHIYRLTNRHIFPADVEGQIFPDNPESICEGIGDFEEQIAFFKRMANYAIPRDTTELIVYMSGFKRLAIALEEVCSERCIKLKKMFLRKDREVRGDKESDYVQSTVKNTRLVVKWE